MTPPSQTPPQYSLKEWVSLLWQLFCQGLDRLCHKVGLTLAGIRSIFRKEIIQLFRDPYLVGFIIALPIAQLLVTGLAIQKDLKHIETVVCNYDKRNASIELLKAFENSTFFDVEESTSYVDNELQLLKLIRSGKYRVGIIIPPDYSNKLLSGQGGAKVDLVVDGTNANIAKTILDAANVIVANHAGEVLKIAAPVSLGDDSSDNGTNAGNNLASPVSLNSKVLYNEELKTSYFLIPAILAIIMHMMTILFTSLTIVRERETGTLEQLMVTPIRVTDLMVGKVIPYAVIGFLDMVLTLLVMIWFFDIKITGSFWFLCLTSIIFILTSLGMGLVISTTCRSQAQSIQLTMAFLLPSMMLSGFVFPLEPMPWFVKIISYSLPLTYYLDIIRGVVIKGSGMIELWPHTLTLVILFALVIWVSILRFKKQVA